MEHLMITEWAVLQPDSAQFSQTSSLGIESVAPKWVFAIQYVWEIASKVGTATVIWLLVTCTTLYMKRCLNQWAPIWSCIPSFSMIQSSLCVGLNHWRHGLYQPWGVLNLGYRPNHSCTTSPRICSKLYRGWQEQNQVPPLRVSAGINSSSFNRECWIIITTKWLLWEEQVLCKMKLQSMWQISRRRCMIIIKGEGNTSYYALHLTWQIQNLMWSSNWSASYFKLLNWALPFSTFMLDNVCLVIWSASSCPIFWDVVVPLYSSQHDHLEEYNDPLLHGEVTSTCKFGELCPVALSRIQKFQIQTSHIYSQFCYCQHLTS
jgi:hypothetical protein